MQNDNIADINPYSMDTLNLVYYSPTGTSKKVLNAIAQNMNIEKLKHFNMSNKQYVPIPQIRHTDLTIIGMPTYAGRLPVQALAKLNEIHANNAPVVLVIVYGNRAYDDALLELKEIVTSRGFNIVAAASFIGEHSYSSTQKPIAEGRPDQHDLLKCRDFAELVKTKLSAQGSKSSLKALHLPGNFPYKERVTRKEPISPETNFDSCTKCGICIEVCPTNAIVLKEKIETNKKLCTACCACVKSCPEQARIFNHPTIVQIQEKLFNSCATRKEPEFFI